MDRTVSLPVCRYLTGTYFRRNPDSAAESQYFLAPVLLLSHPITLSGARLYIRHSECYITLSCSYVGAWNSHYKIMEIFFFFFLVGGVLKSHITQTCDPTDSVKEHIMVQTDIPCQYWAVICFGSRFLPRAAHTHLFFFLYKVLEFMQ